MKSWNVKNQKINNMQSKCLKELTVKEVIEKLKSCNQDAKFSVVVNDNSVNYEVLFNKDNGQTKENTENVYMWITK